MPPKPFIEIFSRGYCTLWLVLALTGCASYPTADLTTAIMPAEQIAERFTLNSEWWKVYDDANLDRLMVTAFERNINFARSAVTVNRALYRAKLLGADLVPSFSADSTSSASRNLDNGNIQRSFQSQLGINYELDLWLRLRNAASAQEWEYKATLEDRASARLALINAVTDTYFELRYLMQAVKVTQDSMARYEQLLGITRLRYTLGKVALVEPLQAEQSLLSAKNNLVSLQTQQAVAEQTLHDLLNLTPEEALAVGEGNLLDAKTAPININVPVAALAARPDIHAAESRLQSAFKTLQSSEASWYPTVTVGSTLGATSDQAVTSFSTPFFSGLVKVTFPFLQWNSLRWNIKISEADFETARLTFIETVTAALNEVNAAYAASQNARLTLTNTLDKHDRDAQISAYYKNRYDLGAAELKDYLDALNTEDASLLAALNAKYMLIRYENLVYKAMGGRY